MHTGAEKCPTSKKCRLFEDKDSQVHAHQVISQTLYDHFPPQQDNTSASPQLTQPEEVKKYTHISTCQPKKLG